MKLFIWVIVSIYFTIGLCADEYFEQLHFNWLPNGDYHLLFNFTFTFLPSAEASISGELLDKFPKVINDFMKDYSVNEFHLSLTQGLWRYKDFGYSIVDARPSGAELWMYFNENVNDVESQWDISVNSLAGLFCASLNFMSTPFIGSPDKGVRPKSNFHSLLNSSSPKYSNLPSEIVCTENLTPWKKLLPCDVSSGIVQLLHANQLFNSKYVSLGVDAYKECASELDCSTVSTKLELSVSVVFDSFRFNDISRTLSLLTLFHKPIGPTCPLARHSKIIAHSMMPNCAVSLKVKGSSVDNEEFNFSTQERITDVIFDRKCIDIEEVPDDVGKLESLYDPPVLIHKYLSATPGGQETIVCEISNEKKVDLKISYHDLVPWHFRLLLHSLKIRDVNKDTLIEPTVMYYIPSRDRERPSTLELEFLLAAGSKVELSMKIEKVLLKWTEYPPDPHHGHSSGASVVYVDLFNTTYRVYSEPLIIQLMVPDFSMPYNVLCLSCTIMTVGYSAAQTLVSRRFMFIDTKPKPAAKLKAKLAQLKNRIKGLCKREDSKQEKAE